MFFNVVLAWIGLGVVVAVEAQAEAPIWGQCGGIGFTGPTACVPGTTCVYSNPYHSQCLMPNPGPSSLDFLFKAKGKSFWGTGSEWSLLSVPQDANTTAANFGGITPQYSMTWDVIEPSQGSFNWTLTDSLIPGWTEEFEKQFHGYTFIWDQHLPSWVKAINDPANLTTAIQNHITTVINRYRGGLWTFDIITEPLNEDGSIKETHFTKVLGKSAFTIALQTARAVDSNIQLYISDFGLDSNNAKVVGMVSLVKELNANGTLVDGIGIEAHLAAGGAGGIQDALEALAASGVNVAITQLEIAGAAPSDYETVAEACVAVPSCVSITSWGLHDLFDAEWTATPAYTGLLEVLS